ncbi:MAG: glycosyltransferase [Planctomycetes bacterium]|nr:glycosyltransferase [Planctomycetota bacterium]
MRIAILCSGLDSIRQGYETHSRLLFDALTAELRGKAEVLLYKRDGPRAPGEVPLAVPSRRSTLCRFLGRFRDKPDYWETLAFGFRFLLHARARRLEFARVTTQDPITAKVLHRFRSLLPGTPRLHFTHAVAMDPAHYARISDLIQETNIEYYERSTRYAAGGKPIALLPYFLPERPHFADTARRAALRARFGIRTPLALLGVGVIKRPHKRAHYLIEEAARLPESWTLVLCGSPTQPDLLDLGRRLLGARFVHLYLPREEMESVYDAADVFAHAATEEGFGMVTLEAMRAGLPVFLHDRAASRWILKDPEGCIDMTREGCLAEVVGARGGSTDWRRAAGERNHRTFRDHFSWTALKSRYLAYLLDGIVA